MSERPVVHFDTFTGSERPGQYERVEGSFKIGGKEIGLSFPVLEERKGEAATETYRRRVAEIRDALSDIIANPHGIRV